MSKRKKAWQRGWEIKKVEDGAITSSITLTGGDVSALPPPRRLASFLPVVVTQPTRGMGAVAAGSRASFGAVAAQWCRHRQTAAVTRVVARAQAACAGLASAAVDRTDAHAVLSVRAQG